MINKDFFPTPSKVAVKMLQPFFKDLRTEGYSQYLKGLGLILEPSAGKGDLIDEIRNLKHPRERYDGYRFMRVHACEKEPELQAIIKSKGIKLVGDDFLNYYPEHAYDTIIMNPPFSEGVKHILHAWDILVDGRIICLLNKETIANPYTKERQLLQEIIQQHNGIVEDFGQCFKTAERKTNVEVVCVRLEKRLTERHDKKSFKERFKEDFLSEFEKDSDSDINLSYGLRLFEGKEHGEIGKYNAVEMRVEQYNRLKESFRQYQIAKIQCETYSEDIIETDIADIIQRNTENHLSMREGYHMFLDDTKVAVWSKIFSDIGLSKYITSKVKSQFDKTIRTTCDLAITPHNIENVIKSVVGSYDDIMLQGVQDVFNLFTKYYEENRLVPEGWKTNKKWKVNRKVILPSILGGYVRDNWGVSIPRGVDTLQDIDKVCAYLTGTDYTKIKPFRKCIESLDHGDSGLYESEFFKFRCYLKGTLHITFKDKDLWERFNQVACNGRNWLGDGS